MKICFYLENAQISHVDLSRPWLGNPGCGGTEFMYPALTYFMTKYAKASYQPIIISNVLGKLPEGIMNYQADTLQDAVTKAADLGADIFVYRPHINDGSDIFPLLERLKLPAIAWAQLTPSTRHMRLMADSPYLKAMVCVGHEQLDEIKDHPIARKSTYIVNPVDTKNTVPDPSISKNLKSVVYLGALVPVKGFHLLAEAWPKVIKQVPDAHLTVIGTGSLYGEQKLGAWGIASEEYEAKHIIPYLATTEGTPHPSVTFAGRLGVEKNAILQRALIGIPNPSGVTETSCISALEFQVFETAVVTGAYRSLLDSVLDKKTGLLGRTIDDLANNIVTLLKNPSYAIELGQNGRKFMADIHDFSVVVPQWIDLFDTIQSGRAARVPSFKSNWNRHYKWIRVGNSLIQRTLGSFVFWPSLLEIFEFIIRTKKRLCS